MKLLSNAVLHFGHRVAVSSHVSVGVSETAKFNNTWFSSTGSGVKENVVETKEEVKR